MSGRIRIVVADDHTMVRAGLIGILSTQDDLEVVGEATNGHEAVEQIRALAPDVALMDVRMPELDGIEATRQLADVGCRILVLTTFDLDKYVYDAMTAGAAGFLLKDTEPEILVGAIRAAARGDALLAPQITRRLIEQFVSRPEPGRDHSAVLEPLTPREREVLTEIGRGRSNSEIAGCLFLSEATVKTHLARLMTKLQLRDRSQAVVIAYESGLVQPGQH
ncbi:MAG: DNA-binding response regulator [Frankiales bacterium]|nr:DNA-binding response regulator [Frankiales bacterium]